LRDYSKTLEKYNEQFGQPIHIGPMETTRDWILTVAPY
jgi:hypothetical protein